MSGTFAGFRVLDVAGIPVLWATDPRFKAFRVVLQLRRPLGADVAARALLPSLLVEGTRRDPDRVALASRMESLFGTSVSPRVGKSGEGVGFSLAVEGVAGEFLPGRPDQLGEGLRLMADFVANPLLDGDGFPADVFERNRRAMAAEVRARIDDRDAWAMERATALACAGEPMAIPEHGGLDAITELTRAEPERVRRDFLRHGVAWVVALGELDETRLRHGVEALLAELPERDEQPLSPPVVPQRRAPRRDVERLPLSQARLVMTWRCAVPATTERQAARSLAVSLFGGGMHSRLFREVREKRSLAYHASAGLDRFKGLLVARAGLDESSAAAAEEEASAQLGEIAGGRFDDAELATARTNLQASLVSVTDSLGARLAFTSRQWLEGSDRDPAAQSALYDAVDASQVAAAAAEDFWLDHVYLLAPQAPEEPA